MLKFLSLILFIVFLFQLLREIFDLIPDHEIFMFCLSVAYSISSVAETRDSALRFHHPYVLIGV